MPIYEYVCKACGRETEIIHGISEPSPKKCPNCGKSQLSKLVSAAGFRLKGAGWYETDFKSGAKKEASGKAGDAATGDGAKTEAKSDSDSTPGVVAPKAGARPAPKTAAKPAAKRKVASKPTAKRKPKPKSKAAPKRAPKPARKAKKPAGGSKKAGRKR